MYNPTIIRDTLVNCSVECTGGNYREDESPARAYAGGIVNGIISVLISQGMEFKQAIEFVKMHAPTKSSIHGEFDVECLPDCWQDDYTEAHPIPEQPEDDPEDDPEDVTYTFDELQEQFPAAVENALRDHEQHLASYDWWEFVYEDFVNECSEQYGIEVTDMQFSGFSCQGDGASFTGKVDDIEKFVKAIAPDNHRYEWLASIDDVPVISFERTDSRYSHAGTCCTDVADGYGYAAGDLPEVLELLSELGRDAEEFRYTLSNKLYRQLEADYEYRCSAEELAEAADANDWRFDENGNIVI